MYGLLNKALESLVRAKHGDAAWDNVCKLAKLHIGTFVSMEQYPDDLTYRLIQASSEVLSIPTADLLFALGQRWIEHTAREGYGELISMFGSTLQEFLENLDNMHARIGMNFPKLRPPSFVLVEQGPGLFDLEYHSEREGLAPMVVGQLKGLSKLYNQPITIEHTGTRAELGHDLFRLTLLDAPLE